MSTTTPGPIVRHPSAREQPPPVQLQIRMARPFSLSFSEARHRRRDMSRPDRAAIGPGLGRLPDVGHLNRLTGFSWFDFLTSVAAGHDDRHLRNNEGSMKPAEHIEPVSTTGELPQAADLRLRALSAAMEASEARALAVLAHGGLAVWTIDPKDRRRRRRQRMAGADRTASHRDARVSAGWRSCTSRTATASVLSAVASSRPPRRANASFAFRPARGTAACFTSSSSRFMLPIAACGNGSGSAPTYRVTARCWSSCTRSN